MAKGFQFDHDLLALIFNATPFATLASAAGSQTTLFLALHTADPMTVAGAGTVGTQNASEAAYASYTRVGLPRNSTNWTVSASVAGPATVTPAAPVSFPAGTAGGSPGTITNWSIGTALSGATQILYTGVTAPQIGTGLGITPILTVTTTVTES